MNKFSMFLDKQNREAKKQLGLIGEALAKNGFKVEKFLNETYDPYVFVYSDKSLSFEGVRIYKIKEMFAFKIQYQKDTHPYGTAYDLEIEDFFNDYLSEGLNPEESVKRTVKALTLEMKAFFKKCHEIENDETSHALNIDKSSMDKSNIENKFDLNDYSNKITG